MQNIDQLFQYKIGSAQEGGLIYVSEASHVSSHVGHCSLEFGKQKLSGDKQHLHLFLSSTYICLSTPIYLQFANVI